MRTALLPILAAVAIAGPAAAATVLSIGDGDTIRVNDNGQRLTIRLACIDAPETAQAPHGAQARQTLQALLPVGSEVEVQPQTIDKYRRTVAEVFRGGQSINLAMVSRGQAYAYRRYLASCDQAAYLGAEANAEQQRLGVWATPGGSERPWDWRQQRRQGSVSNQPGSTSGSGATGARLTCRMIGSFAKAQELLRQGHSYLDRNGDGVACESLR